MILAGGRGTRFKEYTEDIPKPMIEALGKPLLLHIIDFYREFQITNVIILAGYKKEIITNYFLNTCEENDKNCFTYKNLEIKIVDTGLNTMTGGRILKGLDFVNDENFYLTYGDGLSDVDINELTKFHISNKSIATLTAVRPPARFGSLDLEENKVIKFGEKSNTTEGWINGGFFVLNKNIKKFIDMTDDCVFEKKPLEELANQKMLYAFKHYGFWQCVDTIRELEILEAKLSNT
tara:strand:+ start:932 stop:1636 length:705 start_codon:yes stop_codon:yes gene_type:complete